VARKKRKGVSNIFTTAGQKKRISDESTHRYGEIYGNGDTTFGFLNRQPPPPRALVGRVEKFTRRKSFHRLGRFLRWLKLPASEIAARSLPWVSRIIPFALWQLENDPPRRRTWPFLWLKAES
jgi:hypothetical protein